MLRASYNLLSSSLRHFKRSFGIVDNPQNGGNNAGSSSQNDSSSNQNDSMGDVSSNKRLKASDTASTSDDAYFSTCPMERVLNQPEIVVLMMDFIPCFELPKLSSVSKGFKSAVSQSYRSRINDKLAWAQLSPHSEKWNESAGNGCPLNTLYKLNGYKEQMKSFKKQKGFRFSRNLQQIRIHNKLQWRLRTEDEIKPNYNGKGNFTLVERSSTFHPYRPPSYGAFFAEPWLSDLLRNLPLEQHLPKPILHQNDTKVIHCSMNQPSGLLFLVLQRQWSRQYATELQAMGLEDRYATWETKDRPGADNWGLLYHVTESKETEPRLVDCQRLNHIDFPDSQSDQIDRSENGKVLCLRIGVAHQPKTFREACCHTIRTFRLDKTQGIVPDIAPVLKRHDYLCSLSLSCAGDLLFAARYDDTCLYRFNNTSQKWDLVFSKRIPRNFEDFLTMHGNGMNGHFTADGDFCITRNDNGDTKCPGPMSPGALYYWEEEESWHRRRNHIPSAPRQRDRERERERERARERQLEREGRAQRERDFELLARLVPGASSGH